MMYKILAIALSSICFAALAQVKKAPEYPWMPLSTLGNGYFSYADTGTIGLNKNMISMLIQLYPTMDSQQKKVYFGKLVVPVKTCTDEEGIGKLYDLSGEFIQDFKYVVGGISAGDGTITNACLLFEQKIDQEKLIKNKY